MQNTILFFDFLVIDPDNPDTIKIYTGLTSDQFKYVFESVKPSLLRRYKNIKKGEIALYTYLMKLRTNQTNAEIAPHFGVTKGVIGLRIRAVREILYTIFVPLHLSNPTRADLLNHTSPLSRRLYNVNNDTAVVTWDGTYVYTVISSNYDFQKKIIQRSKKKKSCEIYAMRWNRRVYSRLVWTI